MSLHQISVENKVRQSSSKTKERPENHLDFQGITKIHVKIRQVDFRPSKRLFLRERALSCPNNLTLECNFASEKTDFEQSNIILIVASEMPRRIRIQDFFCNSDKDFPSVKALFIAGRLL